MKNEILIARGKTIEELQEDINKITSIRKKEIDQAIKAGYDVEDYEYMHFRVAGAISKVDELFVCPMSRKLRW